MSEKHTIEEHFSRMGKDGSYLALYQGADCSHDFIARRMRVQELLSPNLAEGQKVLDIGCGTGPLVEFFTSRGLQYYGVDVAQSMLDSIRERFETTQYWKNIELLKSSCDHLPYPNEFFDVVVAMGLVEYLEDIRPALREFARVVKAGGQVIVTTPNRYCLNRLMTRNLKWITRVYGIFKKEAEKDGKKSGVLIHRELTPAQLDRLVVDAGFEKSGLAFYDHKVVVYPLTRVIPSLAQTVNDRIENRVPRWFANGYIGSYRRVSEAWAPDAA